MGMVCEYEPSGQPVVQLTGRCRELAAARGWLRWFVSLSHAGPPLPQDAAQRGRGAGYAMASVVAWGLETPAH